MVLGSRLLHRPGTGVLHRGPDAISRHPEGRDKLILARASEWNRHRAAIRGVQASIEKGEFDEDEPGMVRISDLPEEDLAPIPFEELEAAGVFPDERVERRKRAEDKGAPSR